MNLRKLISPVSLLTLVCLIVTGVIGLPTAHAGSNSVVIGEFRTRGPLGGNDEFIELYNLSSSPVVISGWTIRGSNSAGTASVRATIPANTTLNAGCHYLVANGTATSGYSGTVAANLTFTTGVTDDGGIGLFDGGAGVGSLVDAVGMSVGSAYREGTTLAPLTTNDVRGYERKPGDGSGSGTDTDNNASDFQLKSPSDPQNLSSTCIGVSTGITVTGSANPNSVNPGDTALLTVTVVPNTASGVTVTADLTPIAGTTNTTLYDDGTHGDVTAGDRIFSLSYVIPNNSPTGTKSINAKATDGSGNIASATIPITVNAQQLTIMQIQGSGSRSPHEGQGVRTTGVVYDVSFNGFWIQDPAGDGDPSTSDGVFVFTGSAPTVHQGDSVSVSGTVSEFAATGDPSASPQTEIAGSPSYSVLSSNNPLPAPVTITAADIDPNGGIDQLERYEGMRVHIDKLNVIAPTSGTVTEASATSLSNGVFFGVIPGLPRPFRKAGIELPATAPAGSPCCIPSWNGGPQRIRVDTDVISAALGQGLNLTSGAVVSDLTGPLDFGQHAYTLVTETLPTVGTGNVSAIPVPSPDTTEFTVGSFNMERFFDTTNDPSVTDVVLSETAFNNRLNKASLAIRNVMTMPDVIGVEEMENLSTLEAVAKKVNADAVAAGQPNPEYSAHLVEGNDIGGIDVGFLVKSRVTINSVTQYGKDETFVEPGGGTALLNDRPPLVLDATVTNEHETTHFTAIVVHQRSLSGVDDPLDGPRVREKRRVQAESLAKLIQSFQAADPSSKIIVVGDFNAFEVNDGYVDVMGTVEGAPTSADQVTLASSDFVDPNMVDLETTLPEDQRYSYVNFGTAQTLDHVIVSQGMYGIFSRFSYARNDADYPESYRSDPNRPERLSDHDMEVAYFKLPVDHTAPVLTLPADFTQEATSPSGAVVTYTATATDSNDGATTVTCNPASGSTFPLGVNTVSCMTQDARHNTASGEFHANVVDTTAPVVRVTGVADGKNYLLGSVPAAGCSTSDSVSPVVTQASLSVTGGTANGVGSFTATCSGGKDAAGNLTPPVSATYTVSYAWSGFLPPVSNGNIQQAGSTIPLMWILTNAQGSIAGDVSSIKSLAIGACEGGATSPVSTPGDSGLTYVSGVFHINWQTKGLAAGCYTVLLGLDDGSTRSVSVQLK
jgi:predicted extracellular nuclease